MGGVNMLNDALAFAMISSCVFGSGPLEWNSTNSSLLEFYFSEEDVNRSSAKYICKANWSLADIAGVKELTQEDVPNGTYWIENPDNSTGKSENWVVLQFYISEVANITLPYANLTRYICWRQAAVIWGSWGPWSECSPSGAQSRRRRFDATEYMLHYKTCLYNETNTTPLTTLVASSRITSNGPTVTTSFLTTETLAFTSDVVELSTTNTKYSTINTTESHAQPSLWEFDHSSFFLGVVTLLPIIVILAVKHWHLTKQLEEANDELDYMKEGRRRTSQEGERANMKAEKEAKTKNNECGTFEDSPRPHYENIVSESNKMYVNSVFCLKMPEKTPHYVNVVETNAVVSEDDDEYIFPASLPGGSLQYDGYENLDENACHDLTAPVENSHQSAQKPELMSLMKTKVALKPVVICPNAGKGKRIMKPKVTTGPITSANEEIKHSHEEVALEQTPKTSSPESLADSMGTKQPSVNTCGGKSVSSLSSGDSGCVQTPKTPKLPKGHPKSQTKPQTDRRPSFGDILEAKRGLNHLKKSPSGLK